MNKLERLHHFLLIKRWEIKKNKIYTMELLMNCMVKVF